MIRAFYSGTAGIKAQQEVVDIVSNNIANVNTEGFKSKSGQFGDLLYTSMEEKTGRSKTVLAGSGGAVAEVKNNMSDGGCTQTGRLLDYKIDGSGFFRVQDGSGNNYYTRNGAFSIANENGGMYLVNSAGMSVLDAKGNKIKVTGTGAVQAQPGVYDFPNESGLHNQGNNLFSASNTSGGAYAVDTKVMTGYLESSNVDLAQEMTRLIMSQRDYQLSARVVSTADQLANMANEMS
ncbi:MAG TPA: flagellar hook-basal body protein [Clostridia bacterium]|nr:flagellar hook-basal body protein [Clostridia bacterium]